MYEIVIEKIKHNTQSTHTPRCTCCMIYISTIGQFNFPSGAISSSP